MNQIKKIIISTIIGVLALLGFYTTANAYYVGQSIDVTFSNYKENQNIYCVEHKQNLGEHNYYTIISQVKIEGNRSTDHTGKQQTSWYNAKLAYILSAQNGDNKATGPVANSIWNNMYTWMNQVGQYHTGLYVGFANNKKGSASPLDAESDNYANSLVATDNQIKDNTDRNKITVTTSKKDDKSYIRVGPFNWTFPGTMTNVTAKDQDSKEIKGIIYSSFNGTNEYWHGANEIQSGKDFYISVPMNTNLKEITTVTGYATTTMKSVNIWFLEATNGYKQNLIIREPYEAPLNISTPFDYHIKTQGHLKVIKVNAKNETVKLGGVGFYIQHKETGKYVKQDKEGNISYVSSREKATEFITETKGKDKGSFKIKNLIVGTYVAYETKNPNYGYEIIKDGVEHEIVVDKTEEFKIGNIQKYVKLSGYVWIDRVGGKQSTQDNIYKEPSKDLDASDGHDELLNGITVRLKDRTTGKTVKNKAGKDMETVTDKLDRYKEEGNNGNGEYLFMDVLVDKLEDYYIEFEYDGLTYTNVIPKVKEKPGSKAAEIAKGANSREEFNKKFSAVEGGDEKDTGITKNDKGEKEHDLSYKIENEGTVATLIHGEKQFPITANTDQPTNPKYTILGEFTQGDEEIKFINLGLQERAQPDIRMMKDIHNVRMEVNGYGHTYEYQNRFKNAGEYINGFDVGVKFASGKDSYGNMLYSRAIYKSDIDYENEEDRSKELKVHIIYQIMMENNSGSNLDVNVNSLVDYYDSNYEIVAIGTELDQSNKSVINNIDYDIDPEYNQKGFNKVIIYNDTEIKGIRNRNQENNAKEKRENQEAIYVEFALNKEAILNIINDQENLDNVVEVNSYATYQEGKIYAGVDSNSNPGNYEPGDEKYENDTDRAPALKLELAAPRRMEGTVFEDNVVPEEGQNADQLMTGKIRQGSGTYEEGKEKGIANVDVMLTENTGSGKTYQAKTDNNGNFEIKDYIPGDYTLTYTWGDDKYTVQNYKATIYQDPDRQNNREWYKKEEPRQSDAMDNYDQEQEAPKGSRLQIDEEIKTINNRTYTDNTNITRTKMDSTTPTMGIGVEKDDNATKESEREDIRYETTSIETQVEGDSFVPKDFVIRHIDFGIVERARQDLTLTKRVNTLKVTLANGNVIADLKVDEEGNLIGERKIVTYMKPDPKVIPTNGFIRLELDNELIQGATLQVGYIITATNNSELDYLSPKFYHYGTVEGNIVTIKPTKIMDYLDKDWSFKGDDNQQWEIKQQADIEDMVATEVLEEESGIINRWILYTQALANKDLKPNDKAEISLQVSKELTTIDEISLENETEVIELEKTGGSKPLSIPGNYVPGTLPKETDEDKAETTIITPATGKNQNYILPIAIGTTALMLLGAGIVIIKKKAIEE